MAGTTSFHGNHTTQPLYDIPGVGTLIAMGATVPSDAATGYAKGCLFIDTDGSAGSVLYVNEGSNTSADFNLALADETVTYLDGVTAGTVTASKGVVVDANKDVGTFRDITLESIVMTGATGACELSLTDNLADALSVKIASGADLLVLDTTNSNEKITILSAVTQKLGFWGTTPVVQPASAGQADQGAMTTTGANTGTAGAGLSLIGDTTMVNQATNIMNDLKALLEDITALDTIVTEIRTALVATGLMKGSA